MGRKKEIRNWERKDLKERGNEKGSEKNGKEIGWGKCKRGEEESKGRKCRLPQ